MVKITNLINENLHTTKVKVVVGEVIISCARSFWITSRYVFRTGVFLEYAFTYIVNSIVYKDINILVCYQIKVYKTALHIS